MSKETILCILHPSAILLCIRFVIFNSGVSLPAWWYIKFSCNVYLTIFTLFIYVLVAENNWQGYWRCNIFIQNPSFNFISFWHWTISARSFHTRKPYLVFVLWTYLVFVLGKQKVRVSGVILLFQGVGHKQEYHGLQYLSEFFSLVASIFIWNHRSRLRTYPCSKLWSIRELLCFNKFEAAIYDSFYEVKPLTNNNQNEKQIPTNFICFKVIFVFGFHYGLMGCVLKLFSPQAQCDKLFSFALPIFDSFLLVVFLVFFSTKGCLRRPSR